MRGSQFSSQKAYPTASPNEHSWDGLWHAVITRSVLWLFLRFLGHSYSRTLAETPCSSSPWTLPKAVRAVLIACSHYSPDCSDVLLAASSHVPLSCADPCRTVDRPSNWCSLLHAHGVLTSHIFYLDQMPRGILPKSPESASAAAR